MNFDNLDYYVVIAISVIIILSYFFNIISKKTNIPSVILLIAAGIGIHYGLDFVGIGDINENVIEKYQILSILGAVGLILIVLEAALDLELSKEKWPVIWKSFVVAFIALIVSSFSVAFILEFFVFTGEWSTSLICAIPLSIMSSAIIIPSVINLPENRKEFMIYESTFSDILGIMFFYMIVENQGNNLQETAGSVSTNIIATLFFSLVASYVLVWLFQKIKSDVKLFLLIAILCLLYVIGKMFHLSSLLLILIFGLMLNNSELFFQGRLKSFVNHNTLNKFLHEFHILTLESAFLLRTFFFVIFGITITIGSLLNPEVALISIVVMVALYLVRWIVLKIFIPKDAKALLYIAPRGLITVLLFFVAKDELELGSAENIAKLNIENGVILFSIIGTSILMTFTLIKNASSSSSDEGEVGKLLENSRENSSDEIQSDSEDSITNQNQTNGSPEELDDPEDIESRDPDHRLPNSQAE